VKYEHAYINFKLLMRYAKYIHKYIPMYTNTQIQKKINIYTIN